VGSEMCIRDRHGGNDILGVWEGQPYASHNTMSNTAK